MRPILVFATVGVALALAGCGTPSASRDVVREGTSADCAGPQLAARSFGGSVAAPTVRVRAGARLRVHGRFFTHDCFDTGPSVGRRDRPVPRVVLDLVAPGGAVTALAVAHPRGPSTGFVVTVRIPRATRAGRARIVGRHLGGVLPLRVLPPAT